MADPADPGTAPDRESRRRLVALTHGYRLSQAIYVATRLGIPDLLAGGAREVQDLARTTASHAPTLRRVLLVLAGAGVLDEVTPGCFALTRVGAGLRADVPGSLRPGVLLWLDESHWRPWGHLLHAVRTGETSFRHVHGADLFDHLGGHPDLAAVFDAAMTGASTVAALRLAATYDFGGVRVVVDVGGGHGRMLATLLERHPHLRGILFDLPHVATGGRALLEAAGVGDRCEVVAGSFFDSVPAGGDAYVLRDILHDWDDDRAATILANCRRAMAAGGRLLLVERYLDPDPREALPVLCADLEMLVNVGGRERMTDDYAGLLARSGLRLTRTISLGPLDEVMWHHLIETAAAE